MRHRMTVPFFATITAIALLLSSPSPTVGQPDAAPLLTHAGGHSGVGASIDSPGERGAEAQLTSPQAPVDQFPGRAMTPTGERLRPGATPDPTSIAEAHRREAARTAMASNQVGGPRPGIGADSHDGSREWLPSPSASTGEWPFTAVSPGPASGMAALSLPSSGQSDVTVTVTDLGSGQALAGATVDVWFYPSGPDASSETSIETDSAGVATVANLPAGSLQMRITHPDIAYVMAWRYLWVDGSTDQAIAVPLAMGGSVVDTPGIKDMGLHGLHPDDLITFYPDLAGVVGFCRFNDCTHSHEPGCAVKDAVENGRIAQWRYDNYVNLYEVLSELD